MKEQQRAFVQCETCGVELDVPTRRRLLARVPLATRHVSDSEHYDERGNYAGIVVRGKGAFTAPYGMG